MSANDVYQSLVRLHHPQLVGLRIRRLRSARKMTQTAMAKHLEVKANTICQLESGYCRPGMDVETRLKALFGVSVDWIRYGDAGGLSSATLAAINSVPEPKLKDGNLKADHRVDGRSLSRPAVRRKKRGKKKSS